MKTGRIGNAARLRAIPDVVTPRTVAMARAVLAGPDGAAAMAKQQFSFRCCCARPATTPGAISSWLRQRPNYPPPQRAFPATICW